MARMMVATCALLLCTFSARAGAAEAPGSSAPRVVASTPAADARDVDPALAELSVTFSEPMQDRSWSWSSEDPLTFPQLTGSPRYSADGRTCTLPVKLVAGKTYVVWINTAKHRNFRSQRGVSAAPFKLTFSTR